MKQQLAAEVLVGNDFKTIFRGKFFGVLRWHQLEDIWSKVKRDAEVGWYCYEIRENPPAKLKQGEELILLIDEIDSILRHKHDEDYCGVVYVDDLESPTYIKVFDPKKMGTSCSIGTTAPLPEWVISKVIPQDLLVHYESAKKNVKYKKHWLGNLFTK